MSHGVVGRLLDFGAGRIRAATADVLKGTAVEMFVSDLEVVYITLT